MKEQRPLTPETMQQIHPTPADGVASLGIREARANSKELVIETKVTNWAKKHGIPSIKLELGHDAGWPDRMFLIPGGRPVFIEFKRKGEKPRKLQEHRHKTLRGLGYYVYSYDSVGESVITLRYHLGTARLSEPGGEDDAGAGGGRPTT